MNNWRRKQIAEVVTKLDNLKSELETLKDDIDNIRGEEQDVFDNMPENLQHSERGEISENAISSLDDASSSADEAISSIDDTISNLNDIE